MFAYEQYECEQIKHSICEGFEETKIKKVQIGQKVDIKLDLFGCEQFSGKVYTIVKASNSTFSLFPSSSGSTFTKVVQKIPVKIKLDNIDSKFVYWSYIKWLHNTIP